MRISTNQVHDQAISGMLDATKQVVKTQQQIASGRKFITPADDPVAKLKKAKEMLDMGLITQSDYDALKAKALGL